MKAKSILLMLAMALTSAAYGQEVRGISGSLNMGLFQLPNAPKILNATAPQGVNSFENLFFGYGLDANYRAGAGILSLDGSIGLQKGQSAGNYRASAYLAAAHAKLGWIVMEDKYYWLYPALGLGTDGLVLSTTRDVQASSENTYHYILYTPTFDISLNGDFLVVRNAVGDAVVGGRTIGFRLGYSFSPNNSSWRNRDWEKLANVPSYAHRLLYLKIAVGLGGYIKE